MQAKLTADDVRTIRESVTAGTTIADLAAGLDVHRETVAAAAYGRTWRHITDPPPVPRPAATGRRPANTVLEDWQVRDARRRWVRGMRAADLAREWGVSPSSLLAAVHGESHRHLTDSPPVPRQQVGGRLPVRETVDLDQVRDLRLRGRSWRHIGARLGYSRTALLRAVRDGEQSRQTDR